jgi:hypothetical protein
LSLTVVHASNPGMLQGNLSVNRSNVEQFIILKL